MKKNTLNDFINRVNSDNTLVLKCISSGTIKASKNFENYDNGIYKVSSKDKENILRKVGHVQP